MPTTRHKLCKSSQYLLPPSLPGLRSWNHCTDYKKACEGCTGCSIQQLRNEAFPVFPVLLNAVHERAVKVRILTNNFTIGTCDGLITPFDWLTLNGVQVRFHTTTTFQHTKFIVIDKGAKTAVSSVNWSYTSFLKNREAGVILEECTCSAITFYLSVFEYDWENGMEYKLDQTYSAADMEIITSTAHMPYTVPNGVVPGSFVTELIPYTNVEIKKVYASPDNARDTIMSYFPEVKTSLHVSELVFFYYSK